MNVTVKRELSLLTSDEARAVGGEIRHQGSNILGISNARNRQAQNSLQ